MLKDLNLHNVGKQTFIILKNITLYSAKKFKPCIMLKILILHY